MITNNFPIAFPIRYYSTFMRLVQCGMEKTNAAPLECEFGRIPESTHYLVGFEGEVDRARGRLSGVLKFRPIIGDPFFVEVAGGTCRAVRRKSIDFEKLFGGMASNGQGYDDCGAVSESTIQDERLKQETRGYGTG